MIDQMTREVKANAFAILIRSTGWKKLMAWAKETLVQGELEKMIGMTEETGLTEQSLKVAHYKECLNRLDTKALNSAQ